MIQDYENYLIEQEKSKNTIVNYMKSVMQFFDEIGSREIDKDVLIRYKNSLIAKYSPASCNAKICAVNSYLHYAGYDYTIKSIRIHKNVSADNIITLPEYKTLCNGMLAEEKVKYYYMIRFLGETGCRVNELIQFRAEHIRKGYADLYTKGKNRRIYIPDKLQTDCLKWLSDNHQSRGLIFENGSGNRYTECGIWRIMKRAAEKYNVPADVVYPHSFRHMFAVEFLKRDNDISLLSDLLGHESVTTTSIYLRLSSDEQRNRLNQAVNW